MKKEFDKMKKNGEVFEESKGHFVAVPTENYQKGKFIGNAKGFGFVQVDALGEKEDIFIPANMTMNAIDGDEVIVKVLSAGEEEATERSFQFTDRLTKLLVWLKRLAKTFSLSQTTITYL